MQELRERLIDDRAAGELQDRQSRQIECEGRVAECMEGKSRAFMDLERVQCGAAHRKHST